jgi:hypothetical protein
LKKSNSLGKKSFLIGAASGAGLVAIGIAVSVFVSASPTLPPLTKQPISELVGNCFEGYNEGIQVLSKYSTEIEIVTLFPELERENVTKGQILCSLEALDFSMSDAEVIFIEESGRIDNSNFQAKWEALPTCGNGEALFCLKGTTKSWEVRHLTITLKDFRS